MTVEEGCIDLLEDPEAQQAWAVWTLRNISDSISTGVQVAFARKISDPMIAYRLDQQLNNSYVSAVLNPIYQGTINETL